MCGAAQQTESGQLVGTRQIRADKEVGGRRAATTDNGTGCTGAAGGCTGAAGGCTGAAGGCTGAAGRENQRMSKRNLRLEFL